MSIARAVWRGFVRDRSALFFTMLFPLMFLVLFGGIFDTEAPRTTLIQVGDVPLIEDLRGDQKATFDQAFELRHDDNLEHALQKVRDGDADGAVEQQGNRVVVHFSQADRVRSSTMLGVLGSVIDGANVAATGEPPTYVFAPQQVEDESLKPIQYFTPGLLGWALASSATPHRCRSGRSPEHCRCATSTRECWT